MIKTLIYLADGQPMAVLIRGDHEANEGKIRRAGGGRKWNWPSPTTIEHVTRHRSGFAGPVGLKGRFRSGPITTSQAMRNAVTGANEADKH